MSRDELARLGMKLDGVELVEYPDPWPVKGTRAEKRAERAVAFWFTLSGLAGLAFVVAFICVAGAVLAPASDGLRPVLAVHAGPRLHARRRDPRGRHRRADLHRKFIPHEIAVQDRHDGGSNELDKATIVASSPTSGTAPRSPAGR